MVVPAAAGSSTTRKAVSKSTEIATAKPWKVSNNALPGPSAGPTTSRRSRKKGTARDAGDDLLFAAVPPGFREKYVPTPVNPKTKTTRLMIPFYPVGEDRRNGNGLPMVHCLAQQGLKDADDPVFAEEATAGKKSVSLMLSWPGYYPELNWLITISLFGSSGSALTRGELAWIVAEHYRLFFEKCCMDPSINTTDPAWRIGLGGFTFDNVRLAGLWTPGEDVWYASIMVLTPIDFDAWERAGMPLVPKKTVAPTLPASISSNMEYLEPTGTTNPDQFNMEWGTFGESGWGDDYSSAMLGQSSSVLYE